MSGHAILQAHEVVTGRGGTTDPKIDPPTQAITSQSTAYTFDFKVEREKLRAQEAELKAKLALFDLFDAKTAALESARSLILPLRQEMEKMESSILVVLDDIYSSELALATSKKGYDARKADWLKVTKEGEETLFSFRTVLSWFGVDKLEKLKTAAKLAEQNAALIKECLGLSVEADTIERKKKTKLIPLEQKMEETKKCFREADLKVLSAVTELEKLKQELSCVLKKAIDQESDKKHPQDEQDFDDLGVMIDGAGKDMYERGRAEEALVWQSKLENERTDANRSKSESKTLYANFLKKAKAESYSQGVADTRGSVYQLLISGVYARSRCLEWTKDKDQEQKLVDLGNLAAHYGMAVADASLYELPLPSHLLRTDILTYENKYGVNPGIAYKTRSVKRFVDILDWRGGMKHFYRRSYEQKPFAKTWSQLFLRFKEANNNFEETGGLTFEQKCQFFLEKDNDTVYQELKKMYDTGLDWHKRRHQANKN